MIDPSTRFVDIHYHAGVDLYQRRHTTRVAGQRYAEQQAGWGRRAISGRRRPKPGRRGRTVYQCRVPLTPQHDQRWPWTCVLDSRPTARSKTVRCRLSFICHAGRLTRLDVATQRLPTPGWNVARLGRLRGSDESGRCDHRCMKSLRGPRPFQWSRHRATPIALKPLLVGRSAGAWTDRLLLTHPTHPMCGLSLGGSCLVADLPEVYVEVTALDRCSATRTADVCERGGGRTRRIIYSSDLGQPNQPERADWLKH